LRAEGNRILCASGNSITMDAHALLTSQGWRGSGHSLHPTSDTTGLSHPLLVSQKANNYGLGKKQHKTSDMWWMNAFDKSLKGLDTSEEGKVVQKVTNAALDMVLKGGAKYLGNSGGLYASFVRGESLSGTLTPEEMGAEQTVGDKESSPKKRGMGEHAKESGEERRARKAAKRALRAQQTAADERAQAEEPDDASVKKLEAKEDRRERRQRKRQRLLSRVEREAGRTPSESKRKKKRRKE
jgi:nucleolar protein TMA23